MQPVPPLVANSDSPAQPALVADLRVEPPETLDGVPAGVQTFDGFRRLTAAELDADFGEYTVRATADAPPQVVASCRAFLKLPLSASIMLDAANEAEERSFWFSVIDCAAWSIVQAGKPANHTRLGPVLSAQDPTHLLPPLLGLTDFMETRQKVEAAAASCVSWKAFEPSLRAKQHTANGFRVRAVTWHGDIKYLARADFDGDGEEDLLIRRDGEADGGSYRGSALFLLGRTDQDKCLRVTLALGQS